MHAGTHGKAGCIQRNFLTPWFKQSRTRSNNHQKKPLHLPSKREAFPPLRWFKFLFLSFFNSFCPCASIGEILYFWQGSRAGWAAGALRSLASVCVSSAWAERRWEAVLCGHEDLKDVATSPPHCPAVAGCLRNVLQPGALATAEIWEVPEFSLPLSFYTPPPPPRRLSHPHRNTPSPPVLSLSHSFSPHPFLLCWQIRSPPPFFR